MMPNLFIIVVADDYHIDGSICPEKKIDCVDIFYSGHMLPSMGSHQRQQQQ